MARDCYTFNTIGDTKRTPTPIVERFISRKYTCETRGFVKMYTGFQMDRIHSNKVAR